MPSQPDSRLDLWLGVAHGKPGRGCPSLAMTQLCPSCLEVTQGLFPRQGQPHRLVYTYTVFQVLCPSLSKTPDPEPLALLSVLLLRSRGLPLSFAIGFFLLIILNIFCLFVFAVVTL